MQFKVGDRVEAIKPPNGVEEREADQIGLGHIVAINSDGQFGETHAVKLDSGDEWYYSEDRLRHPIVSKPTPTPSITVGTQVRLTGVVGDKDGDKRIRVDFGEDAEDEWAWIPCKAKCLEVIRQPFKRGEVVYSKISATNETPFVVLNDESLGFIDVTNCETGFYIPNDNPEAYERRP